MAVKQGELVPYIFEHEKFGKVRAINFNGEPLFVGRDIAIALGYADSFAALKQHVPDKFKRVITAKQWQQMASQKETGETPSSEMASQKETGETLSFFSEDAMGGVQRLTFITEQGMYRLVFRSNLPEAEEFTDWTCEVLISIRKYGYYSTTNQKDMDLLRLEQAKLADEHVRLENERTKFELARQRLEIECAKFELDRQRLENERVKFELARQRLDNDIIEQRVAIASKLHEFAMETKDDKFYEEIMWHAIGILINKSL